MRFLEAPCFEYSASAINARGQIVGGGIGCPLSPTEVGPLIWARPDAEGENLQTLGGLHDLELGIHGIGAADAINARGQAAGWSDASDDPFNPRDIRATLWDNRRQPIALSGPDDFAAAANDINDRSVVAGRAHGEPTLFVPGSRRGFPPAGRPSRLAPDARQPAAPGVPRHVGLREALVGARAEAEWAVQLCTAIPRVRPAPAVSEVLAGCP